MRRTGASPGPIANKRGAAAATGDALATAPASASLFAAEHAAATPKARKGAGAAIRN